MGITTTIVESRFRIGADKLGEAYEAACALNAREDLKRCIKPGAEPKPKHSTSVAEGPGRKFWLASWNYDATCASLPGVLADFGFDVSTGPDGSITGLGYCEDDGDQELLLEAIAPYVDEGSMVGWAIGYSDLHALWFTQGGMLRTEGYLSFPEPGAVESRSGAGRKE